MKNLADAASWAAAMASAAFILALVFTAGPPGGAADAFGEAAAVEAGTTVR